MGRPETRSRHEHDWLTTPSNVTDWLEAVGLGTPEIDEADIAEIDAIRRILSEVLRPLANERQPARVAVERLNRLLSGVLGRRRIDPVELIWTWETHSKSYMFSTQSSSMPAIC